MNSARRIVFAEVGGPEVLSVEAFDAAPPAPGQVLVEQHAIGVNFIDTYHRTGLYPLPLPATPGSEGAGIVTAVGGDVTDFTVGDRVAWIGGPGGYATHITIDADKSVPLPDTIGFDRAAAAMLKGCTAWMLAEPCGKVRPGDTVLVHAAAGGVGSILVPWLVAIGARVIAHAGTPAKAAQAQAAGAHIALSCPLDDLADAVRAATGGDGVGVVFDGVGRDSWESSLASVAKRGLIASYGNASGPVPPVSPLALGKAGSVFLTRPSLFDYAHDRVSRRAAAARLFEMLETGAIDIAIGLTLPLDQAAEAHRRLEGRRTTGSIVLTP